ncbi:MAG: hypothetical protein KDC24_02935 [Saprospiraceae bacterium]|nr:hypothetical protein [Saprospiraceae bacterium]
MKNTDIIIREEHRFSRYEVMGLLLFFILGLSYSLVRSIYFSAQAESVLSLALTTAFIAVLSYLFYQLTRQKLSTRVSRKNIKVDHFPLFGGQRKIKWKNISHLQAFAISPGTEWSGWMVTFGQQFKDYCASRHKGVLLTLDNGEQVFIQTDQPETYLEIYEELNK